MDAATITPGFERDAQRRSMQRMVGRHSTATLYLGDCKELLPMECDIVLTDPPYGIGYDPSESSQQGIQPFGMVMGDDEPDSRGRSSGGLDPASVAKLTRQLKALAKRLGVPFIVLTHVPRPLKDGPVRRPTKWDVKWAGEGDADNVIFVHRPIMLMSDTPPVQGRQSDDLYKGPNGPLDRWYKERASMAEVAELVVAKTRGGPEAVHRMRWDGPRTALREWDWQPEPVADAIPEWVL